MQKDYPIRVGSMLYTQVDPEPGHEVEYNRWYERDHFYAGCMVGPWLFAGRRWVATKDLKALRFPAETPFLSPVTAGSYVAIYWILDGRYEDHREWATEQVNWLYANGRGFANRVHRHTGMYGHQSRWYRDDDPVPLELALDHEQYVGMVSMVLQRADGVEEAAVDEWLDANMPAFLAGGPVASVSKWATLPILDSAPSFVPRDPDAGKRSMHLFFLEEDPRADWERFRQWAKQVDASGVATVVFAAPWIPTVVGTDTYTDQL
jgi:hypothetical protein